MKKTQNDTQNHHAPLGQNERCNEIEEAPAAELTKRLGEPSAECQLCKQPMEALERRGSGDAKFWSTLGDGLGGFMEFSGDGRFCLMFGATWWCPCF